MSLNVTYDDNQIILDTAAYLCNIHIRIISSLGLQTVVDMSKRNDQQMLILEHNVESQGDY